MSQFEEDNSSVPGVEQQADAAGGAPDMGDESEIAFVAEGPKSNHGPVMFLVGLLLLGGATLYFMRLKAGPSSAQASAESTTAKKTITEFLSDGGKNITQMRDTIKNTEVIVQQFASQSSENQVGVEALKTNPFQMLAPKPKLDPDAEKAAEMERQRQLDAERLAKVKQEVLQGASALRVESIMLGGRQPVCMINNTAFTTGQEINGYKIETIEKSFIIVSKSGFRLKLAMQGR